MTRQDRDYDDILSRVLHSTLDPIEPLGDGLAKIQQRIAEPWLKRQVSLLRTETSALGWLILVRCEPFFSWAKSSLTAASEASGRWLRPGPARSGAGARTGRHGGKRGRPADGLGWLGPTIAWLRPALAVAGAVAIVVAGVFAVQEARNLVVSPTANTSGNPNNGPGGQPGSHHKGSGSVQSTGSASSGHNPAHQPTGTPAVKGKQAAPSTSCSPTPAPTITSPSPSPTTTSPTPTPTTTSPTPTPPTSPSPTAPSGGTAGSGNGGVTNDVAAVSFRAAKSLRGQLVRASCASPSISSGGPAGFGSG